jgi:recombination protein RecT
VLANPEATVPAVPRSAATVVLLRTGRSGRPEILLTRRPAGMAFAGDAFVFPGGRVDDADADPRLVDRLAAPLPPDQPPFAIAAIRELLEEAGVLLAERRNGTRPDPSAVAGARRALLTNETTLGGVAEALDLRLRTDLLAPIAHWTTPPIMPRRFATRFFAAELPAGAEPSFEAEEVTEHRWLAARDALDAMAAGEIAMWVPTSATLQQLEHATSFAAIADRVAPGDAPAPRVIGERPGLARIVLGSAGAVPGQTVNAYLVGQGEFVVVDPGDPSDEAADAILGTVLAADGRLAAIALTHVDPDHAAGAEGLALRLDVSILAGPGAGRDLPYLVRELADGERIGAGGVELEVVATPGPRPDHVAFRLTGDGMGDEGPVILAGDLVGPRADRAILGAGDENAWSASLERIREQGVARVFPGHGEPLDGPVGQ